MYDHRLSLDGSWDFQVAPVDHPDVAAIREWRTAVVPMPWQAQFSDLRHTSGTAWYRRHFTVDLDSAGVAGEQAAILHFGAVDYHATIWLNGKLVGEHEGGYLPFEFDVITLLQPGDNELLVRVVDATDDRQQYADFPFSELPHGKQSWYGPIGGIWQSVYLEIRPRLHITHIALDPSPQDATVGIRVTLSSIPSDIYQVVCTIIAPNGQTVGLGELGEALTNIIPLNHSPELWSPDSPALYTVVVTLHVNDVPTHTASKTCGFRTIETRNGRITLNGSPIYLRGALDQGYYPETIYTPNSLEQLENQVHAAKALGLNCLRIHIKIEDPRYYDVADRLGLLIWTEIPNWALLTDAAAERARQTFRGMVERDGHHPSIFAWTLVNENWGTDLTRNRAHRQWLADFFREAKLIDPTRLIVDNSACCDNAHVASDLEDFHYYRAIPDHAREWDAWVADFAARSKWAWSSDFGDGRASDLPRLVSEFGNWGLPDPATIQEKGAEPWWFETGFDWGDGIVYPHGVLSRYEACGLADLFPSYTEFARQSQIHMARSLHYEITTMRLHEAIAGYIVTEFTDVHWECNGLLTMQRQPKYGLAPLFSEINQDQVVLLRPMQWSGLPGESLEIVVQTHGILGQQSNGTIQWQAGQQKGKLPAPGGTISLRLDAPGVVTLSARWLAEDGALLATNQVDLVCVASQPSAVRLHVVGDVALANTLRNLGYDVREGEAEPDTIVDEIVVACRYTHALQATIQNGGCVLLLASESDLRDSGVHLPIGYIVPREGSSWQGDWATSFAWVKKEGPLAHLPGSPLLEMEWGAIMPDVVLAGLPPWVQRHHSWAGLAVGWVHKPVSLLTAVPYGRGRILITTFKLNAATLASDAVAQALFAGMVNLL